MFAGMHRLVGVHGIPLAQSCTATTSMCSRHIADVAERTHALATGCIRVSQYLWRAVCRHFVITGVGSHTLLVRNQPLPESSRSRMGTILYGLLRFGSREQHLVFLGLPAVDFDSLSRHHLHTVILLRLRECVLLKGRSTRLSAVVVQFEQAAEHGQCVQLCRGSRTCASNRACSLARFCRSNAKSADCFDLIWSTSPAECRVTDILLVALLRIWCTVYTCE